MIEVLFDVYVVISIFMDRKIMNLIDQVVVEED